MKKKNPNSKIFKRWSDIGNQMNEDQSDEYYTLIHCFYALLTELLARYHNGKVYKVIICPCDGIGSVFRELTNWAQYIGNPQIIFSSLEDKKSWVEYFDLDYEMVYNCQPNEVCIFTNPPFTNLRQNLLNIKCDFILLCSKITSIPLSYFVLNTRKWTFIKNTDLAGTIKYGTVPILFTSNTKFYSFNHGGQYQQTKSGNHTTFIFNKDCFEKVFVNKLYK